MNRNGTFDHKGERVYQEPLSLAHTNVAISIYMATIF